MVAGVRPQSKVASDCTLAPDPRQTRGLRQTRELRVIRAKIIESVTLTIKIFKAYDKERNIEMGCADHRISSVCHPYRPGGYILYKNVKM